MPGDIFATKGLEYLLVIVYFVLLIATVRYIAPRAAPGPTRAARRPMADPVPWFSLADGYLFHQGHAWAAPGDGETVTVGLDDFAAKLVGPPDDVQLPAVGAGVRQGEPAWTLRAGDRKLAMLSPVEGEIVAVNPEVLGSPRLAADDPYGKGWLLKVRPANRKASLRNLFSGEFASVWMKHTVERLRQLPAAELGVVMPDGGAPVHGFGRVLGPAEWESVARDFFLSD